MVTLKQSGFRHAARGHTSLEEILSVVADQE
jgi:type II secretory ATPase GspE/PulE/Tfp pilus assembly ATPase PilB-like protein